MMNHWIKIVLLIFSFIIIFLHHFHFITVAREMWFSDWLGLSYMLYLWRQVVPLPPPSHLDWMGKWRNLSKQFKALLGEKWWKDTGEKGIKITKTHQKLLILFPSTINIFNKLQPLYNIHYHFRRWRIGQARSVLKLSQVVWSSLCPIAFFVYVVFWENRKEVNIICLGTVLKTQVFYFSL